MNKKPRGKRKGGAPSLKDILGACLEGAGLSSRLREQKVIDSWEKVVGKGVAEATQPVRVWNKVLQIRVVHSVWMQQLQFYKKMMIEKINEFSGEPLVKDLRFVLGEKDPPAVREKGASPPASFRELRGEEKERIRKEVSRLKDEEIREALCRLFSKGLACGRVSPPQGADERRRR